MTGPAAPDSRESWSKRRPLVLLAAWVALVLLVTVPWTSATDHAHWWKVSWIPFPGGTVRWRDLLANVLLYVPLGVLGMALMPDERAGAPPGRLWRAAGVWVVVGAALSAVIECSQVWSHARFPSATDVLANATGTGLGIWLSVVKSRRGEVRMASGATKVASKSVFFGDSDGDSI